MDEELKITGETGMNLHLASYEGELCRICTVAVTKRELLADEIIYAGQATSKPTRVAHRRCFKQNQKPETWEIQ